MATAEIYSEGRGIFDAMPYVRAMEAKQKAKDEATTKYFKDLSTKINTAGVRSQDIIDPKTGQGIQNDINNWTDYYKNNRDAIIKGGVERLQFEKMQREILNRIEQSKNAGKFDTELGKYKFEGKYDPTDDDMHVIDRSGASIYDPYHYKEHSLNPNYKDNRGTEFGFGDISLAIPPLTTEERGKLHAFSLGGQKKIRNPNKPGVPLPGTNEIEFETVYPDDVLKNSSQTMANLVKDNPIGAEEKKVRNFYVRLKDDPTFITKATPVFQKYFGRDIQTPQDAAAADFLLTKSVERDTEKASKPGKGFNINLGGQAPTGDYYDYHTSLYNDLNNKFVTTSTGEKIRALKTNQLDSKYSNVLAQYWADKTQGKIEDFPEDKVFVAIVKDPYGKWTLGMYRLDPKEKYITDDNTRIGYLDWQGFNTLAAENDKQKANIIRDAKAREVAQKQIKAKSTVYEKASAPPKQPAPKKIKGTNQPLYKTK